MHLFTQLCLRLSSYYCCFCPFFVLSLLLSVHSVGLLEAFDIFYGISYMYTVLSWAIIFYYSAIEIILRLPLPDASFSFLGESSYAAWKLTPKLNWLSEYTG